MKQSAFEEWIDTFVSEKGLDQDHHFEVEGEEWGTNFIPLAAVICDIKLASHDDQMRIKAMLIKIDFRNGNVMDYFKGIAQAMAR